MKIINAHSELIDRPNNQLKLVERIGRTCYKSENLITDDSYIKFCKSLIDRQHYAMLEHAVFTFEISGKFYDEIVYLINLQAEGYKYFVCDTFYKPTRALISANLRAIIESHNHTLMYCLAQHYDYLKDVLKEQYDKKYIIEEYINDIYFYNSNQEVIDDFKDHSVNYYSILRHIFFTCYFEVDRGITHEIVRHRVCSFAQSSTRYCNYSKGKFGNEITVIEPCFFEVDSKNYELWKEQCINNETTYMTMLKLGAKPEEARSVLPTSVAAELWITANLEEWQHIINLRYRGTTGKPHPQMVEVMKPIAEWFENSKLFVEV